MIAERLLERRQARTAAAAASQTTTKGEAGAPGVRSQHHNSPLMSCIQSILSQNVVCMPQNPKVCLRKRLSQGLRYVTSVFRAADHVWIQTQLMWYLDCMFTRMRRDICCCTLTQCVPFEPPYPPTPQAQQALKPHHHARATKAYRRTSWQRPVRRRPP
eukprot:1676215-Pleurochrysis_carterae.AAC.1